jgi:hypothetical protein
METPAHMHAQALSPPLERKGLGTRLGKTMRGWIVKSTVVFQALKTQDLISNYLDGGCYIYPMQSSEWVLTWKWV